MAYQYGVYTSENATSIQAGRSAASALPLVFGIAPWWTASKPQTAEEALKPRSVRSYASYQDQYGNADLLASDGWAQYSLDSFARAWWLYSGQGEAFICNVLEPKDSGTLIVSAPTITVLEGITSYAIATSHPCPYVEKVMSGDTTFVQGTDYSLSYSSSGALSVFLNSDAIKDATPLTLTAYDIDPADLYSSIDAITVAIGKTWQVYQTFLRAPTMLLAPYFSYDAAVAIALKAATLDAGGGRLAMAYVDVPSRDLTVNELLVSGITTSAGVLAAKPASDPRLVAVWGTACVGAERFEGSCFFAAKRASTDVANGGFPYVSPCNQALPITSVVAETGGVESAFMVRRAELNDAVCANGVVTFDAVDGGWVLWGELTTAAPSSTDIKDMFHSTRAMMDYLRNDFAGSLSGRVSLPINLRQVDGIIKSYSDRLGFFVGSGAIVSGYMELNTTQTTATELVAGRLHFDLFVSPPPPIVAILGTFEWDVESFVSIITGGN